MRASRFAGLAAAVILVGAVASLGPWQASRPATVLIALSKLAGLVCAVLASFRVVSSFGRGEPQRRPWLVLAVALACTTVGQSVLAYHQVVLDVRAPFPSAGDPFFVIGALLIVWAMVAFARAASSSGLPLGTPLQFWSPALAVLALLAITAYPVLYPIFEAPATPLARTLNVFYPAASFVTLAPLAVMQRVGLRFRGGALLRVWGPLTIGFAAVLVSDVLFAYFSTLSMTSLDGALDFLYLLGYWVIPAGVLGQVDLLAA